MALRTAITLDANPQHHPAVSGGNVVIISGESPTFKQHATGPQGHAALGNVLEHGGFDYEPIHGKEAGKKQPGYIVYPQSDADVEKLQGIAKRMGQESIVRSKGGRHQLIYTAGENEGKATPPSTGVNWYGDKEPNDNHKTLYGPSGEPLGHFSYNLDFGHPLIQHGPGPTMNAPEAANMVLKSAVEAYRNILLDLRKRETDNLNKKPCDKCKKKSCDCTKKYEVESKNAASSGPRTSDDISAQGFAGVPTNPNNDLVTGGGPIHHLQPQGHNGAVTHKKTEKSMKLHDLMKAQAVKMQPLSKPPVSEAQRRAMGAAASGHSTLDIPKSVGKEFIDADKGGKLPETKKTALKASIFKRMPDMTKGESDASKKIRATGGVIKLGKQEFYIDLANCSDPKKRLKETNPVKESVVPGGKETGWKTDGPKSKVVEHSASGGAISKNPPKAGPDQKNTSENSVTEGAISKKATPKNDLIEKAALSYHSKMNKAAASMAMPATPKAPGAGSPKMSATAPTKPPASPPGGKPMGKALGEPELRGGRTTPPAVASPKATPVGVPPMTGKPATGVRGTPSLNIKNPVTKALMPFGAQQEGARADYESQVAAGPKADLAPKAQPKSPNLYDPSMYQPTAPVSSGLELAGPPRVPPGTGVTPKPVQKYRSVKDFLGKAALCKSCGKSHSPGKCE